MRTIEIFRLRRVRDKPAALRVLDIHAGLPTAAACTVLHQALGGGRPRIVLDDDVAALACIRALARTGLVARFAAGCDGYDTAAGGGLDAVTGFHPEACAHAALQASWPQLLPAVADAVAHLLLQDKWPDALEHALLHLRAHAPAGDSLRQRLENAATACGLQVGQQGRA